MDISKEYILMCEKAVEIQSLWSPDFGDRYIVECKRNYLDGRFFRLDRYKRTLTDMKELETNEYFSYIAEYSKGYIYNSNFIWLPRQDQLQSMLPGHYTTIFEDFYEFYMDENNDIDNYTSMEQVWLAFIMHEKFEKSWNGKDWGKG